MRTEIEARIKDVRDALTAQADVERVRAAVGGLSEALQKAGSAVYGGPGAEGGPEAAPPPEGEGEGEGEAPAEEGTVEGEYREV